MQLYAVAAKVAKFNVHTALVMKHDMWTYGYRGVP